MFFSARSSSRAGAAATSSSSADAPPPKPATRGLVGALLLRPRPPPSAAGAAAAAVVACRGRAARPVIGAAPSSTTSTTTATTTTTTTTPTTPTTTSLKNLLPPGLPSAPGRAVIVGAGPSGVATAIALARRGFSVDLFERRPRGEGSDPRRTFGIVLGERALRSLERVGVDVRPLRRGRRMLGSVVATQQGVLSEDCFADPAADDEDDLVVEAAGPSDNSSSSKRRPSGRLMVVERAAVVAHLLAEAERLCPPSSSGAPLRFHWSRPLAAVDFAGRVASFADASSPSTTVQVPYDLLVGADGASSAVRARLEDAALVSVTRLPSPASSMEYGAFHGLSDGDAGGAPFFVPKADSASGGTFFYTFLGAREIGSKSGGAPYAGSVALYRRPDYANGGGPQGWSGIVALPPGKFDALLGSGEEAYERAMDPLLPPAGTGAEACAKLAAFPALWRKQIVEQLAAANKPGSIGRLTPLAASSAVALPRERVVLLGDAASSNTPQMGQGAGSALEDAALLAAELDAQVAAAAAAAATIQGGGGDAASAAAVLLGKAAGGGGGGADDGDEQRRAAPPLASALAAYGAARQPQRAALQAMERELAVFRRPAAVEGQEPAEDLRARRAWRAFMAQQKVVGQVARLAAASASWAAAAAAPLLRLLLGGGGGASAAAAAKASSPLAIAARMNQWSGWTQLLHSGVPYDRLLARIHAAPAVNAAIGAAAIGVLVGVAVAVARALLFAAAAAA